MLLILGVAFAATAVAAADPTVHYVTRDTIGSSASTFSCLLGGNNAEEEDCLNQVWCWQGARFADLNQLTKQITVTVSSSSSSSTQKQQESLCVDYETDDRLASLLRASLLPRVMSSTDAAEESSSSSALYRLQQRNAEPHALSALFSSLVHKLTGAEEDTASTSDQPVVHHFSAYSQSCVALCKQTKRRKSGDRIRVDFESSSWLSMEAASAMVGGLALLLLAPRLSQNRAVFYLSGGVLGVLFAVAGLVLLVGFRTLRPTRAQVGLAFSMEFSLVLVKDLVWRLVVGWVNVDWAVAYVLVTFTLSVALVHYWMSKAGSGGGALVNPALVDFCQLGVQIMGILLLVSPVPSATLRMGIAVGLVLYQLLSHWLQPGAVVAAPLPPLPSTPTTTNLFQTPKRATTSSAAAGFSSSSIPLSVRVPSSQHKISLQEYDQLGKEYTEASVKALLASPEGKMWLSRNLDRFQQS